MKVLFVSNYYPPYEVGGYEQLCRDVALRLIQRGYEIQVLTSDRGVSGQSAHPEPGIHRLLRAQPIFHISTSVPQQFFVTRRKYERYDRQCLQQLIAHTKPDVVMFWSMQQLPRTLALEAEAAAGTGVAYWLAGYSPAEPDEFWIYWRNRGRNPLIRLLKAPLSWLALSMMRREGLPVHPEMRHVGVVSEYARRTGIAAGTLPESAYVLYNGVELDQFEQPVRAEIDGALQLLQAGRLTADKGVHTSLEAIGRLAQEPESSSLHLHIAGTGPDDYRAHLQSIIDRYQIADKVTFHGWLPREQMPALMAQSDVLLLPTGHNEPFARVVLEAMAGGLTVIGALTGGTGEVVKHNVTGLTFPAENSQALAEQIKRLMLEPGLRARLAQQGQQLVRQQFSLERMVDNIELLLKRADADRQ